MDVGGVCLGRIEGGVLALIGIAPEDTQENIERMLDRLLGYRIFADEQGRLNLNLQQVQGGLLLVPNFSVMADTRKGMRPGFSSAAPPAQAAVLFKQLTASAQQRYAQCQFGRFGADMQVSLNNDGPITLILEA